MSRSLLPSGFFPGVELKSGLTTAMIAAGGKFAYTILDAIDEKLLESGAPRLATLVELANLSTILGNLLAEGIVQASSGIFKRAGAHKYQDLRATGIDPDAKNIEIKVALETNNPKAHLAKAGHYLTFRYVLGKEEGEYKIGERGDVVWIWEVRFGHLQQQHFNLSSTPGDSGKTAVINREGLDRLVIVYFDQARCPFSPKSQYVRNLRDVVP